MIGVSIKISGLDRQIKWVGGLTPKTKLAIRSGMSNGGDKVRTDVRKALQIVSGATKYASVVKRSQGFYAPSSARGGAYVLRIGRGDGDNKSALPWLKADEFKERVSKAGIIASPWAKPRLLKRSFAIKGRDDADAYRVRLPGQRKTRRIYGPNLAKEFLTDIPAYVVTGSIKTRLVPEIGKRLDKAWGI
ncbi:hypothetical protein FB480_103444 [Agrobacterium vitis]|nr:hypothetical protein FB480_103444 [Agrobacterium vitis]